MDKILENKIENAIIDAVERGRHLIPKDTGNLRFNATLVEKTGDMQWEIYVSGDGSNGIAPYAPFTNEPWLSDRWHGKPNPNEGWWDKFTAFVVDEISKSLGADNKGEQ